MYIIYYYLPILYCCRYGVNGIICMYSETDETHNFYFNDAIALYSINVLFLSIYLFVFILILSYQSTGSKVRIYPYKI